MHFISKKESIINNKILFTVLILLVYIVGRKIPLYGINMDAYQGTDLSVSNLLMQSIGGDNYRYSLFALGISPYMISSMSIQMWTALRKTSNGTRISMYKTNRQTIAGMIAIAIIQAVIHVEELSFLPNGDMLYLVKATAVVEMITGAVIILWLSERNKKYGIGGQTALILVNILDSFTSTLKGHNWNELIVPLLISVGALFVIVLMENTEKRIPVQRISIHNLYSDENYLAIKLNPIGIMPIMFSTAFFMIPQLLIQAISLIVSDNPYILWWEENLILSRPLGIAFYIGILYFLTILFSMVFVNPGDLTEQFLKSGDSLLNIHAGKDTKKYLTYTVIGMSIVSSTIMGICVGLPLILQLDGKMNGALVMVPSSVMMLTGIWCNLFQEVRAARSFDQYQAFL